MSDNLRFQILGSLPVWRRVRHQRLLLQLQGHLLQEQLHPEPRRHHQSGLLESFAEIRRRKLDRGQDFLQGVNLI